MRRLLFCLWVVAIKPTLVASYDPPHGGWINLGMLKTIFTDFHTALLLLLLAGQEPRHKPSSHVSHVQIRCTKMA